MLRSMKTAIASAFLALSVGGTAAAQECFIGEIKYFAGNFAPRGYAAANGQLLAISQHSALFSILGTNFGGDGRTTFGLPDLRGRAPIGVGQGPGLSNFTTGAKGGTETTTLSTSNLPAHSHNLNASTAGAASGDPGANVLANSGRDSIYGPANALASMAGNAIGNSGSGQAFNHRDPFLAVTPIICLNGIYPSRN